MTNITCLYQEDNELNNEIDTKKYTEIRDEWVSMANYFEMSLDRYGEMGVDDKISILYRLQRAYLLFFEI